MAESNIKDHGLNGANHTAETTEHGCFDFLAKKEGRPEHDEIMNEPTKEIKEDLRRLRSQSSPSDDEDIEGERKKNKKTPNDETNEEDEDAIKVVDVDEKKGFFENIKAHLSGNLANTEESVPTPEPTCENDDKHMPEKETHEKKNLLEKIKEKLHKNDEVEIGENKKDN